MILAGAFGSFIDPKHALVLGLAPDCDLAQVYAVGDAAGNGARIALLNRQKRAEAQELANWVIYLETDLDPVFQDEFVAALHLPQTSDPFPHFADILPQQPVASVHISRRPRTRRKHPS